MGLLARHPLLSVEAIATRLSLAWELRTLPIDRIVAAPRPTRPGSPEDIDTIGAIGEIITTRIPGLRSRCLVRTLVRFRLLRRRGYDVGVRIGLDPSRADIEGHAWLELDGAPLYEAQPPTCVVTLRSP